MRPPMYERLEESDGNVLGYRLFGRPSPEEVAEVVRELKKAVRQHGEIRVLLQLPADERPDLTTAWRELRHLRSELREVSRIAIVGQRLQERWYVGVFGALVPMPVRYFDVGERERAWEWLRS